MLSLKKFLENAPKKMISGIYRSRKPDSGLINNQDALTFIYASLIEAVQEKEFFENFGELDRQILKFIYTAEERGLKESECYGLDFSAEPEVKSRSLSKLEDQLLIYCRKSEEYSYHGFQEFQEHFSKKLLDPQSRTAELPGELFSYRKFLPAHLIFFLSQVHLGHIRITQSGEFHHKDLLMLLEKINFGRFVAESYNKTEIKLIYNFCADKNLIHENSGTLGLSSSGLEMSSRDNLMLERDIYDWWRSLRLNGGGNFINLLSGVYPEGIDIKELSGILRFYSESCQAAGTRSKTADSGGMTWAQLPMVVREMWLMGIIDFKLQKGKIFGAVFNAEYISELMGESEHRGDDKKDISVISQPNMETLIPPDTPLKTRFVVELISTRKNDENLTRYKFTKDSVIAGLQSGVSFDDFLLLLENLGFSYDSKVILKEWGICHKLSEFADVLILKMNNQKYFEEFSSMPQFLELTREVIPGYGFIIPRKNKDEVRSFVNQFGLFPKETNSAEKVYQPVQVNQEHFNTSAGPDCGKILYRFGSNKDFGYMGMDFKSKYAGSQKAPSLLEKVRITEFAIVTEKKMELSFSGSNFTRIPVRPLHLMKDHDPVKLIGVNIATGQRSEYLIKDVTSLRIFE